LVSVAGWVVRSFTKTRKPGRGPGLVEILSPVPDVAKVGIVGHPR
jgi:hypothetical protein